MSEQAGATHQWYTYIELHRTTICLGFLFFFALFVCLSVCLSALVLFFVWFWRVSRWSRSINRRIIGHCWSLPSVLRAFNPSWSTLKQSLKLEGDSSRRPEPEPTPGYPCDVPQCRSNFDVALCSISNSNVFLIFSSWRLPNKVSLWCCIDLHCIIPCVCNYVFFLGGCQYRNMQVTDETSNLNRGFFLAAGKRSPWFCGFWRFRQARWQVSWLPAIRSGLVSPKALLARCCSHQRWQQTQLVGVWGGHGEEQGIGGVAEICWNTSWQGCCVWLFQL